MGCGGHACESNGCHNSGERLEDDAGGVLIPKSMLSLKLPFSSERDNVVFQNGYLV
jgi:hypothetical protein